MAAVCTLTSLKKAKYIQIGNMKLLEWNEQEEKRAKKSLDNHTYFNFLSWLYILQYPWASSTVPTRVRPLFSRLPPWPHLPCVSVFLPGLAYVEPTACVGALVCQQWNGYSWQASGRQRETGAEEAWLTDGSADTLGASEEMRGGGSSSTTAPPLSLTGPLLHGRHISLSVLRCRSHSRCHLLPFKGLHVSHRRPLSVTVSFPFTLSPFRFLSLSSPFPHHTHVLFPCVLRDMNAAAAPCLVCSWPLLCIAFSLLPHL